MSYILGNAKESEDLPLSADTCLSEEFDRLKLENVKLTVKLLFDLTLFMLRTLISLNTVTLWFYMYLMSEK
jgi:hypothetical protein